MGRNCVLFGHEGLFYLGGQRKNFLKLLANQINEGAGTMWLQHHADAGASSGPCRGYEQWPMPTTPLGISLRRVFTGIVEEKGTVISREGSKLRISATTVLEDSDLGASIAVNGCCLTLVASGPDWWEADVSDETYTRTNLGALRAGDPVNLERPMALGERFGGHIVLGHVDAVGEIVSPVPQLVVRLPSHLMRYIVEKGSITVDGISLTAFNLTDDTFEVAIIPHTAQVTTLGVRNPGDTVNIEMDVLAKHVERLLEHK